MHLSFPFPTQKNRARIFLFPMKTYVNGGHCSLRKQKKWLHSAPQNDIHQTKESLLMEDLIFSLPILVSSQSFRIFYGRILLSLAPILIQLFPSRLLSLSSCKYIIIHGIRMQYIGSVKMFSLRVCFLSFLSRENVSHSLILTSRCGWVRMSLFCYITAFLRFRKIGLTRPLLLKALFRQISPRILLGKILFYSAFNDGRCKSTTDRSFNCMSHCLRL